MPTKVKSSGGWSPVKSMFYKQNGQWVSVQRGYTKVAGSWVEIYSAAVMAIVTAMTTNLNISTLFSTEDWQDPRKKKIVQIAAGVIVGSANPAIAALLTGAGRGGELEIIIDGEVQGAGGVANGGAGGPAVNVQQTGAVITNNGAIRGGGGAGGHGGNGGQGGSGTFNTTQREPTSGTYYTRASTSVRKGKSWSWRWFSTSGFSGSSAASVTYGGWTYYRGALQEEWTSGGSDSEQDNEGYRIHRQRTVSNSTTGGAGGGGGTGGRGQGYNQAQASGTAGAAGSPGGTNAGTGGTGGTGGSGGDWGQPGATGNTGATGGAGNAGGGATGAGGFAGGTAGPALTGQARTFINNGTVNGAV